MTELGDNVRDHYQAAIGDREQLLGKIESMLDAMGGGPVTAAQLAGLDQFHFGGLAATRELAMRAGVVEGSSVLDAGSGLGGPSRFLAEAYKCDVTGVDLAPDYVAISALLAKRARLEEKVRYHVGDLLRLPFQDASFDLVWTQHVVMNIRERDGLYRELRRVLKRGGKFAFYDVLAGDGGEPPHYPVPWAETSEVSTLLTEAETRTTLTSAHLHASLWDDVTEEAFAWLSQQQQSQPLTVGPAMVVGPRMAGMVANFGRNLKEGRTRLVMGVCEAG